MPISLFTYFQFYSVLCRDSKVDNFADFLFLLVIMRSCLLAEIRWSVCISKFHRSLCVSFSRTDAVLCIYHLLAWSNLIFLHIYQWITLPIQSCLDLYSFCANSLHSLIMWLIVSYLSLHSLIYPRFDMIGSLCCHWERLLLLFTYLLLWEFLTPVFRDGFFRGFEG